MYICWSRHLFEHANYSIHSLRRSRPAAGIFHPLAPTLPPSRSFSLQVNQLPHQAPPSTKGLLLRFDSPNPIPDLAAQPLYSALPSINCPRLSARPHFPSFKRQSIRDSQIPNRCPLSTRVALRTALGFSLSPPPTTYLSPLYPSSPPSSPHRQSTQTRPKCLEQTNLQLQQAVHTRRNSSKSAHSLRF